MIVKQGKYKDVPVLEFWDAEAKAGTLYAAVPVFSFGVRKAEIILSHLADIREFYKLNNPSDDAQEGHDKE